MAHKGHGFESPGCRELSKHNGRRLRQRSHAPPLHPDAGRSTACSSTPDLRVGVDNAGKEEGEYHMGSRQGDCHLAQSK